jgi:hypothetical protein
MTTAQHPVQNLLDVDPELFRDRFDRLAFAFQHRLAGHPLFQQDALFALASKMAQNPDDVYYDAGDVGIGQRWEDVPVCDIPVDQLLHSIETANAWIVLRKAEKFPEYAAILDACMAEIEQLSGRNLGKLTEIRNAIIFINSPHRVSSYHIDRECNFLLQIRGRKTISIHDRNDRDVLPEDEIERFWTVDNNAAVFKPEFEDRAFHLDMTPGSAVHIPVNSPHWVKNGPEVSVSLSINFHYHERLLADVYRANYLLRKLGLKPKPPGASPTVEALKAGLGRSTRRLHRATQVLKK